MRLKPTAERSNQELIMNNMNGKMLRVIVNMYKDTKSRIVYKNEVSEYFPCSNGVRQGENLSPFLFAIYLNDLESFIQSCNINGLSTISDEIEDRLDTYVQLFAILYADDTVLMAETPNDLQKQLDSFSKYCEEWKLKVNVDKSKIVIFSRGRLPRNHEFKYRGTQLEIVNEFNYLGVLLNRNGNFQKAKKEAANKGLKAMYEVLKLGRLHCLSIKTQLDLFDKMVVPCLLYGSEIWGFGKNDIIERVHLRFCKLLLQLKTTTPSYMIYGELGRFPLDIYIKTRMVSFWTKLVEGKTSKLSTIVYKLCYHLNLVNSMNLPWITSIQNVLDMCGLSYVWNTQTFINKDWIVKAVKLSLKDQFRQNWHSEIENSPKALCYRLYKQNVELENYFDILEPKDIIEICKFRTTNHKLPIENGRWQNIERQNRKCTLCNANEIGDEFHYIMKCQHFEQNRKMYISNNFLIRPNILKFENLMTNKKKSTLSKLCKFIRLVNKELCAPG